MTDLLGISTLGASALEFLILSAARAGMVAGAQWSEINVNEKIWTIPPERMKNRKSFRVPLSDRAFQIAAQSRSLSRSSFIFEGSTPSKPIAVNTINMTLKQMNWGDRCVVHGFRS